MLQFARWTYNAYAHGMTLSQLDKALPLVDRGQDLNYEPLAVKKMITNIIFLQIIFISNLILRNIILELLYN